MNYLGFLYSIDGKLFIEEGIVGVAQNTSLNSMLIVGKNAHFDIRVQQSFPIARRLDFGQIVTRDYGDL